MAGGSGRVTVVGLGPAGPDLLTRATLDALDRYPVRFVRTRRHPAAAALGDGASSFDGVYDAADRQADVYPRIVEVLVAAAREHGAVLYAVPGSPRVGERSVELLVADGRVEVEVLPALSFADLAWVRLGVDPLAAGVRLVDGQEFAVQAAGHTGALLASHCHTRDVLSAIKLAVPDGAEPRTAVVLQRLGLPDEAITEVAWADLDRAVEPDHLTSVWIPELGAPVGAELVRFAELVRTLRERCPWDREQTHRTLTRHLLEETYEVLEAIEALPPGEEAGLAAPEAAGAALGHLEEELGDLLFQVVFHATIGAEAGAFTLADVARGIHDKLVRRHPHVFGAVEVDSAEGVMANWEQIKKAEKGHASVMDGIPGNLPSLLYAHKVQRKAASLGFDWDDAGGAAAKVAEELAELTAAPSDEELGDLLFAVVNVARHLGIDPEAALRGATAKFRDRVAAAERLAEARGVALTALDPAALDELWEEVKAGG